MEQINLFLVIMLQIIIPKIDIHISLLPRLSYYFLRQIFHWEIRQ